MPLTDIARRFECQGAALGAIRATDANGRIEKLKKLESAIKEHFDEAIAALAADLGKPAFEAVFDIGAAFTEIGEVVSNLRTWMQPSDVLVGPHSAPGASAQIIHQPKGRVLIFGPWNFPFSLLFQPLIGAVAAGNAVVLKPSELAPATAALSAKIVAQVFDADEVALFEGGVDTATELLDLPFDHIFFTGSTSVGRHVMAAAAKHLSSVTLELGGKCPVIIDSDVDLQQAAERVAWGKFLNAGQICLAPDHIWLRAHQQDGFAAAISGYIQKAYCESGAFNRSDFAKIINGRNQERLATLLDGALAQGAHIVTGGGSSDLFLEPTVLTGVVRESAIMRDEIFGPILPILTYDDINELIAHLNTQPKPLALYVFSDRPSFVNQVIAETSSGGVTVNDVIQHATDMGLPFGGTGASGMGRYHGHYSFLEFSHARSVYRQSASNPAESFLRPPYGDRLPA